jgi:hypothetical protein
MNAEIAVNHRPLTPLGLRDKTFYLWSTVFVLGNLALPQLCHLTAAGGKIWLPIYFFTLVAAARCGWKVGVLTAILSPLLNHALFAMPPTAALPAILVKSLLIAGLAPLLVRKFALLPALALTVIGYQLLGGAFEALTVTPAAALADFRLGWPGLLAQLFGGWLVLKLWNKPAQ